MASLKPNETQRPKELPATRRQVASNKNPFVGTSFCQNRPGGHPTCSIRRRPKESPGRASRASSPRAETFGQPGPQAKAFGRVPENRPLDGFLNEIPPHRFEFLPKRMGRALIDIGQ